MRNLDLIDKLSQQITCLTKTIDLTNTFEFYIEINKQTIYDKELRDYIIQCLQKLRQEKLTQLKQCVILCENNKKV